MSCPKALGLKCWHVCEPGEMCGAFMLVIEGLAIAIGNDPEPFGPTSLIFQLPINRRESEL